MDHPTVTDFAKDFKVAIVGGGMCGLACAIGLIRAGVDVEIFEAAPKFGEVGAGVGLGPNAIRALKSLGILDEVMTRADQPELTVRPFMFISGLEGHELVYDYPTNPDDVGLGIHRAAFLDSLVYLVDPQKTHFNKRCTALSPLASDPSRIQITFADGTTSETDVVLGADGIRSSIRKYVVGTTEGGVDAHLAFTNTNAYRGLVPDAKLKSVGMKTDLSIRPHCWTGPGKHIITFPIKGGQIINIVAFVCDHSVPTGARPLPPGQPWVTPRTTAELLAEYTGWGPDVQKLLECMESPSVWSIHAVDPLLENYNRGSVALLGDAAHGMLPHLGAGAGQALEDALMLSRLLGHPLTKKTNVEAVLQIYDIIRRPRANMVLTASARMGDVYEGYGPSGSSTEGTKKDLTGMWDRVWHHDMDADIERAEIWLAERGVFAE